MDACQCEAGCIPAPSLHQYPEAQSKRLKMFGFGHRGQMPLGRLENAVMEVLWHTGEANVRDVALRLPRPLAYTTVMTTCDRLYKKGLLERRKQDRAFFYSPRLSRREWEQKRAGDVVAELLANPEQRSELLISCFVDAVSERD